MMSLEDIVGKPDNVRKIDEDTISDIILKASRLLEKEASLISLEVNEAFFVGDTHGDFQSTINVAKLFLKSKDIHLVFLGDYVDRGPEQVENINYLLALKCVYPYDITLLRGNHESPLANVYYGFLAQVHQRLKANMYHKYSKCFASMPYGVLIDGKILCLHGGIAKNLTTLKEIEALPKGDTDPENPIAFQILWNDPSEDVKGFQSSMRGSGINVFGRDVYEKFAEKNRIIKLIRAHEYFASGFHYYFNKKILSLFTCRYYPNTQPRIARYKQGRIELLSIL